jgi:hypothetical protein
LHLTEVTEIVFAAVRSRFENVLDAVVLFVLELLSSAIKNLYDRFVRRCRRPAFVEDLSWKLRVFEFIFFSSAPLFHLTGRTKRFSRLVRIFKYNTVNWQQLKSRF